MRDSLMVIAAAPLPAWARWRPGELIVELHVQPGARRTAVLGEHGRRLKIALHAPPVDGKANAELLRFLASALALRRGELRLLAGPASREKSVAIDADGHRAAAMAQCLRALCPVR